MQRWNTGPGYEDMLTVAGRRATAARTNGKPMCHKKPVACDNKRLPTNTQGRSMWPRFLFLTVVAVLAALARLIPHPPNVSPVGAIALFGGAFFPRKRGEFLAPLAAMLLSDLVLGLHALVPVVYGCFALNVLLGRWLRSRRRFVPIALATVAGAVQFFIVTNFACWVIWYPHTLEGICTCYVAAIPFFHNMLVGDAAFTAVLFGGLAVAEAAVPILREEFQLISTHA